MPRFHRKGGSSHSNGSQKAVVAKDTYRNHMDQPCCLLLEEATNDIWNESSSTPNLATAIRHHLQHHYQQQQQQQQHNDAVEGSTATTTNKKKKKKKKKKNKANAAAENGTTDAKSEPPERIRYLRHYIAARLPPSPSSASSQLEAFVRQHLAKAPCRVSTSRLEQAIQQIACKACRDAVQWHLRAKWQLPLTFGLHNNDDTTTASCDYVAMEEGREQPGWHFWKVEEGWELRYAPPLAEQGDESAVAKEEGNETKNHWTWERFLFFLEHGILVPSLPVDHLLQQTPDHRQECDWVRESSWEALLDSTDSQCQKREEKFLGWAMALENTMKTLREQPRRHHDVDLTAFNSLQNGDKTCQKIMFELWSNLLKITITSMKAISFYSSYSHITPDETKRQLWEANRRYSQKLLGQVLKMWSVFGDEMEKVADATAHYERSVEASATAMGMIPPTFSAQMRTMYRDLVDKKTVITSTLLKELKELSDAPFNLLDPVWGGEAAWNVHWYRHLVTQESFQKMLLDWHTSQQLHNGKSVPNKSDDEGPMFLDAMIATALTTMVKWLLESVTTQTVQKLIQEHEDQTTMLCLQIENLLFSGRPVQPEDDDDDNHNNNNINGNTSNPNEAGQQHAAEEARVLTQFRTLWHGLTEDRRQDDDDDEPLTLRQQVEQVVKRRTSVWKSLIPIVQSWFHDKTSATAPPPDESLEPAWLAVAQTAHLPYVLKRRLLQVRPAGDCPGGKAQYRTECILLGLVFRWMDEGFQVWHSWVAEQELLRIDEQQQQQQPSSSKKSKKKNKAKKVKAVADKSTETMAPLEEPETAAPTDTTTTVATTTASPTDTTATTTTDTTTTTTTTESPTNSDPPTTAALMTATTIPTDSNGATPQPEEEKSFRGVGVVDGDSFISAEDFLVGRFRKILRSPNTLIV